MHADVYEYAVIRIVPKVEREEFMNVGVIVYCKKARFIRMKYQLNANRLLQLNNELDLEQLEDNLRSFEAICNGDKNGGPLAQEDIASRFRWLTAVRSSVIQTSRPHPGMCGDPAQTVESLFNDLVQI